MKSAFRQAKRTLQCIFIAADGADGVDVAAGAASIAAPGVNSNSFRAAGGSFSTLLKKVTSCQVCVSFSVFFHAGIPDHRIPC
jgi:hypothetical protein